MNNSIHDYVFHFNEYTKLWYAIPRNVYKEYWDNQDTKGVLKSKEISVLIELINKGTQFIEKL
jgi:hypothetical protein